MNFMKKDEYINLKIGISKIQSEVRSKARISECFHYDRKSCRGKVKMAHTIQQNGRLSLLEENINGNTRLYSFTEIHVNEDTGKPELKPVGKGAASTFLGFCDYHDNVLFAPIEDNPFSDTTEQCFLYSYRAFAQGQHRKAEQIKAFESESKFKNLMGTDIEASLRGTLIGYKEGEVIRARMNDILENKQFDELESLTIELPHFYPIASCASFTPNYSPKTNTRLNYHKDPTIPFEHLFFNVIPDYNGTIIMFSCLPESKKSIQYIDEFDSLKDLEQKKILTSILIGYVENTFIAPSIYNSLTTTEKDILAWELGVTSIFSGIYQPRHFISELNLFKPSFIKNAHNNKSK